MAVDATVKSRISRFLESRQKIAKDFNSSEIDCMLAGALTASWYAMSCTTMDVAAIADFLEGQTGSDLLSIIIGNAYGRFIID